MLLLTNTKKHLNSFIEWTKIGFFLSSSHKVFYGLNLMKKIRMTIQTSLNLRTYNGPPIIL